MDKTTSCRLIEAAGGPTKFAVYLGLEPTEGVRQRIWNWKTRGIPDTVALRHQKRLRKLQRQVAV